jgi:hypothetical protein
MDQEGQKQTKANVCKKAECRWRKDSYTASRERKPFGPAQRLKN